MVKLVFVLFFIAIIFLILWQRNKNIGNNKKSNTFRNLLIIVVITGILFFLATSGKFIFPQLIQIIKMALPLLTKLIGI